MWSADRVVCIATVRDGTPRILGTGTVLCDGRVLTARHVLEESGTQIPKLVVKRDGSDAWSPYATSVWCSGERELDVAVLSVEITGAALSHALMLLNDRSIRSGEEWFADGYPTVRTSASSERVEQVRGASCHCEGERGDLNLDVSRDPEVWGGLSGAGVIVGRHLVGVVKSAPNGWKNGRITATPVAQFIKNKGFRSAVGIDEASEKLTRRLLKVVGDVDALFKTHPAVTERVAERLARPGLRGDDREAVVRALLWDRSAVDVIFDLLHVDEELTQSGASSEQRKALRRLLMLVLPIATDWQSFVLAGVQGATINAIELPLRSETIAEVILAGIDGRSAELCRPSEGNIPKGNRVLNMPAAMYAPLLQRDSKKLADAMVGELAPRLNIRDADVGDPEEKRRRVATELAVLADDRKPVSMQKRYSVLFVDEEVARHASAQGGAQTGATQFLWGVARGALEEGLRALRLVRLSGARSEGEITVERLVYDFLGDLPEGS